MRSSHGRERASPKTEGSSGCGILAEEPWAIGLEGTTLSLIFLAAFPSITCIHIQSCDARICISGSSRGPCGSSFDSLVSRLGGL